MSARYAKIKTWYSSERFRIVWQLGKAACARTSAHPSQDLAFAIGVDRTTAYRWMNSRHKPSPMCIPHIDAAFSQLLGDDWTDQVEQVERALS